jgi:Flp pilus assembly pilin Flp
MPTALAGLLTDEHGGVVVETALLLVLVAVAAYSAYQACGQLLGHHANSAEVVLGGGEPASTGGTSP